MRVGRGGCGIQLERPMNNKPSKARGDKREEELVTNSHTPEFVTSAEVVSKLVYQ